ncbi:MAG: sporulation protein YabP [Clostridia bacterium]|nr:sporulation protein YabP [Clostridia bacterium]
MAENKEKLILPHNIILKDRKSLTVTGVTDVDSFDETAIIAYTDIGELTIRGTELKINKLSTETGELFVDGNVSSLSYLDNAPKSTSFFGKLFR